MPATPASACARAAMRAHTGPRVSSVWPCARRALYGGSALHATSRLSQRCGEESWRVVHKSEKS